MENPSSENELKELLREGRITEKEYAELLSEIRRNPSEQKGLETVGLKTIPLSLKIVAWLFIIGGISAVIEILISLAHGRINFNFGVLGIPAGFGILKLSRGWRVCGLVLLWFGLIITPIIFIIGLTKPATVSILGYPTGKVPGIVVSIIAIPIFLLLIWQYRVLTRPDIKELFGLK